jgi:hypothetical protein
MRHRGEAPEGPDGSVGLPEDASYPPLPEPDFAVRRTTLIALLAAAIALPFLYTATTAYSEFRARDAAATDVTMRTVRIAEEHALKVFDMNEMLDARIDSLVRGLGDDQIRAREADVHDTLLQLGGGYSQIASISIFGTDGMLLAIAGTTRHSLHP